MDHVPTPEDFMREALKEAEAARRTGEVPIGAVVVRGSDIVGRGHNRRETGKNACGNCRSNAGRQY